jgi:hypothetical protein
MGAMDRDDVGLADPGGRHVLRSSSRRIAAFVTFAFL